ncbi:hypothetical protein LTS18_006078, partial [Coniosporium uncinatum]
MTTYEYHNFELQRLAGKTILITGGATGVGRAAVELAHRHGANVALGDCSDAEGQALASTFTERFFFRRTDVSNWTEVLDLFATAHSTFGTIHAVLSDGSISDEKDFLDDHSDADGQLLPPNLNVLDVNITGTIQVTKAAAHYFAKWPETRCQIVMTTNAASFIDTPPPQHLYSA